MVEADNSEVFGFSMTKALDKKLRSRADKDETSMSDIVRQALTKFLK